MIRRYRRDGNLSYALGMTVTIELLLSAPDRAAAVFLSSSANENETADYLRALCEELSVPIEVNDKAFNVLSSKGNCFVIGAFNKFERALGGSGDRHVVLVNPSDSGNLGTIIRTAVGFGIPDIAVIKPAADVFDPKTVRASMGAIFRANCVCFDGVGDYIAAYPSRRLYAFALRPDSVPIGDVTFSKPFSMVFGSEAAGLPDDFPAITGATPVVIPHTQAVDSLNLTVAAGIAMFAASSC